MGILLSHREAVDVEKYVKCVFSSAEVISPCSMSLQVRHTEAILQELSKILVDLIDRKSVV